MFANLLPELVDIARRAGDAILEIYESDFAVETKADDSPLTQADLAAHRVIIDGLAALTPQLPMLSEESQMPSFSERSAWPRYWLIDPLDGTKEFVNRNGEFTVNIALIEGHEPSLGVVGVPTQGLVYTGDVNGGVATRHGQDGSATTLAGRSWPGPDRLAVVASRNHGGERLEAYLEALAARFGEVDRKPVGSSLKLCILAEGRADIYPRLGPTSEWDIGAAHAVLLAAGGGVWAADGSALSYNAEENILNPEFFAVSDRSFDWRTELPPVPAG